MFYYILGNTYAIKEDLKSCGCFWVPEKKQWKTPYLEKDELLYKKLVDICKYSDCRMVPAKLTKECAEIQKILNKKE
jgi:hypothetical protein